MDNSVEISLDRNGLVIENAAQRLTGEVAQALVARRSAHLDMLAVAHETDLTPEIRQESSELRRRVARTMMEPGLNFEGLDADLRDAAIKRSDQISTILKDRIARRERIWVTALPKWSDLFVAPPVDHSFWWAQTQSHVAPDTPADFRDDGLHFWGGPQVNNQNGEMHTSFGAVASFALQPERFPTSASGSFLSSPHVELFGGIVAFAPDHDLFQGDGHAAYDLFLRQTIFQWRFGPTGSVAVTIAEAKGYDAGHHLELINTGSSWHHDLPGFKLIPAVMYSQNQVAPNELWAEIEVRLDIYLKSAGAFVWCDPEVLVRTFQWAPTPLP
jgi:hypothetical protein